MKKYNDKINVTGEFLAKARKKKRYTKTCLSRKLEVLGVSLDRNEIYRIENFKMSIKDFEFLALATVLEIDFNEIRKLIFEGNDSKENEDSVVLTE